MLGFTQFLTLALRKDNKKNGGIISRGKDKESRRNPKEEDDEDERDLEDSPAIKLHRKLYQVCLTCNRQEIQLNPAVTDLTGLIVFIHYRRIFAMVNMKNKDLQSFNQETKNCFHLRRISVTFGSGIAGLNCIVKLSLNNNSIVTE